MLELIYFILLVFKILSRLLGVVTNYALICCKYVRFKNKFNSKKKSYSNINITFDNLTVSFCNIRVNINLRHSSFLLKKSEILFYVFQTFFCMKKTS